MDYREHLFGLIDEFTSNIDTDLGRDNANFVRSNAVMETILKSRITKDYLFNVIYEDLPVRILHDSGFLYHHQTHSLGPYCIGLSSYDIVLKGLKSNAKNERAASPPKRIETLLNQAANLICLLAQEVSGATSVNDLSTTLAGYLYVLETMKGMKYTQKELENCWQSFLYNVNLPFRSGNSPFSNVTLDFSAPTPTLAHKMMAYAGEILDFTYSEIPSEYFDRINDAFIDAMDSGDDVGHPFTFPLVTVNVTDDFDYENPSWKYLLDKAEGFGGFYIQNYCTKPFDEEARKVNPFHHPYDLGMLYSNCCRMTFDLKDLMQVTGANPFASGSGIGGINVIAINLNRIMWLSQCEEDLLFPLIDYMCEQSAVALERKREWLTKYWNVLFPYLSYYVKDSTSMFSILSVLGAHEGLMSCGFEKGIYDKEGQKLAHKIGKYLHGKIEELTKTYRSAYTLEFAPSENAACRLASKDLKFAEDMMKAMSGEYWGDDVQNVNSIMNFDDAKGEPGDETYKDLIYRCFERNKEKLFSKEIDCV